MSWHGAELGRGIRGLLGQVGTVVAVTGERAVAAGRMARWMLLACTLFGLAAMHTLGHAGMRMDAHPDHGPAGAAMAAMDVSAGFAVAVSAVADDCPGCAHASAPHGPVHGGMPGWGVCLAVLTALAVLLLASLLWARSRPVGALSRDVTAGPQAPRGPPGLTGLTLARLSVLRI